MDIVARRCYLTYIAECAYESVCVTCLIGRHRIGVGHIAGTTCTAAFTAARAASEAYIRGFFTSTRTDATLALLTDMGLPDDYLDYDVVTTANSKDPVHVTGLEWSWRQSLKPFTALPKWSRNIQVWLNGREWLARQMDKRGLRYRRLENAFLWLEDPGRVQRDLPIASPPSTGPPYSTASPTG